MLGLRSLLKRWPRKRGIVLLAMGVLATVSLVQTTIQSDSWGGDVEQTGPDSAIDDPPDTKAPSTPTGLIATGLTQTTVTLAWNPSTDNVGVAGYRLYEYLTVNHFSSYWLLRIDDIKLAPVRVTGLKPGSTHRYAVTAIDGAGNESDRSATLRVKTLQSPLAYHPIRKGNTPVQAKVGERFIYEVDATGVPPPTFLLVAGPKDMQVDFKSGTVQWTPMAEDVGTVTATVRARNSEGSGDYTFSFRVHPAEADFKPPSVVRNPVVTKITTIGGTLTWHPATDNVGVAGYYIKAQQNGRGHSSFIAGKSVGSRTTYTISNLKPGTGYRIWVVAYDAAGNVASSSGVPPAQITTLPARVPEIK